ncbi:hypothetical protein ACFQ6B_03060 [Streptomyces wedmorensis]|uniref:Uncharacterized protein n=1 Tax=Streptomyces wedmorensis TaxID=43759 RepID=A0ABW6J0S4_STRWE
MIARARQVPEVGADLQEFAVSVDGGDAYGPVDGEVVPLKSGM